MVPDKEDEKDVPDKDDEKEVPVSCISACDGTACRDVGHCRSKWGFCGDSNDFCNLDSSWKSCCDDEKDVPDKDDEKVVPDDKDETVVPDEDEDTETQEEKEEREK